MIVSTQRFDRLGIFALPCQTKNGTTKKNFHSIQEMQKILGMTVKVNIGEKKRLLVPLATATLDWNF